MEAVLYLLAYYSMVKYEKNWTYHYIFVTMLFLIRPMAVLPWGVVYTTYFLNKFWKLKSFNFVNLKSYFLNNIGHVLLIFTVIIFMVLSSLAIDYLYYGDFKFTLYNFYKINVE